ncbi:CoA pyrophosphatase [Halieaceae bacterium IMCC8485]|uniref:CoA pyrophosphatase n=2 Tax=Candidatus Seongchinamella marina TaxID=2518990 RepID=A0ABT3T1Z3_9GAMM|nr:CoA pyrophosphatase [Candidatus Seongchinamella marina]
MGWLNPLNHYGCVLLSVSLLQLIETRLPAYSPKKPLLRPLMKRSAVAMVLQVRQGELNILMIKRAEREGDPWSGHMAFPGGRMDKTDANGYSVAVRETEEEVGLTLGPQDRCLGRLSDLNARPRKHTLGMAVSPFIFHLEREVEFTPNYEVAEVVWVPLEFLLDSGNREKMTWDYKGVKIPLPCYQYEQRCIWGLSLMMLDELMDLVEGGDNPLRPRWRRA